jgi:hypothetical protein
MQRFKSVDQSQRFLLTHGMISGHLKRRRNLMVAAG